MANRKTLTGEQGHGNHRCLRSELIGFVMWFYGNNIMSYLVEWLRSGDYLPVCMRDFHDQKIFINGLVSS